MTIGSNDSAAPQNVSFTLGTIGVSEEPEIAIESEILGDSQTLGEEVPPQAEEFSIEDSKYICTAFFNLPGMFWGSHLTFKEGETDKFAEQFHRYCIKKEINPYDYFFDEFPLAITGIALIAELRKRHKEYKEEEEKKKRKEEEEEIK